MGTECSGISRFENYTDTTAKIEFLRILQLTEKLPRKPFFERSSVIGIYIDVFVRAASSASWHALALHPFAHTRSLGAFRFRRSSHNSRQLIVGTYYRDVDCLLSSARGRCRRRRRRRRRRLRSGNLLPVCTAFEERCSRRRNNYPEIRPLRPSAPSVVPMTSSIASDRRRASRMGSDYKDCCNRHKDSATLQESRAGSRPPRAASRRRKRIARFATCRVSAPVSRRRRSPLNRAAVSQRSRCRRRRSLCAKLLAQY